MNHCWVQKGVEPKTYAQLERLEMTSFLEMIVRMVFDMADVIAPLFKSDDCLNYDVKDG